MPTPERLEAFIAAVEGGAHAKAIEDYYTEDATMRENQAEPRRGRATLVAQESAVLARTESVASTCVRPVLVNGDHVAIHWVFDFTFKEGSAMRMEEIAWQRWEGECIAEEQFFYDPAQRKPA
ncbi:MULTISPECIES: nuclear transport factor 2 family protein [unclassified Variovorax]|uniref:nuclear transport factor 2 family protein n=1 Tax=unclassified Variovorax TaxID=663243 RepID=UPI0008D5D1C1|nr:MULTISPECIES: nuclear transport factor 2 family protein [unclassified Variovorax]SEJ68836.1 SnoaL-like domain-containing protein [Variovorax sp. OK202]SFC78253.1 SnoaL-like domain-containing protein [Variovorax sp. OK212]